MLKIEKSFVLLLFLFFLIGVRAVLKDIQSAATRVELLLALAADMWLVLRIRM